jgi:hypothetical protein
MSFTVYPTSLSLKDGFEGHTAGVKLPTGFAYKVQYWIPVVATVATEVIIGLVIDGEYKQIRSVPVVNTDVVMGHFEIPCRKGCILFVVDNPDPSNPTFTVSTVPYTNITITPLAC